MSSYYFHYCRSCTNHGRSITKCFCKFNSENHKINCRGMEQPIFCEGFESKNKFTKNIKPEII